MTTLPADEQACAAEPLSAFDQELRRLRNEVDMLTKAGIIEVAVRNPSVAEYMAHWEGRALQAEAELSSLRAQVASLQKELAERTAERDRFLHDCAEYDRALDDAGEKVEAAEVENARLRALPLKEEVEQVLSKLTTTNPSPVAKDYDAARALLSRIRAGGQSYAQIVEPYTAAQRMIRDAIQELFGSVASLESEDATLLRGPEPHHEAEAQIDALMRVAAAW